MENKHKKLIVIQVVKRALIYTYNAPKCVWRPGSARTRWTANALPQTPSRNQRPTSRREGGEEREGMGRRGEERNREGKSGRHGEYISILDLSIDGLTI